MPATMLATGITRSRLILVAVALGGAAAGQHHLRVLFLRYPRHHRSHILKREAIAEGDLDRVVNVAADFQHAEPVALQNGVPLLLGECKLFEISRFILFEFAAVLRD